MENELHALIDDVLILVDIFTILSIDDNPVLGIVFIGLLKVLTTDRATRISLILLIIILNLGMRK